MDRPEAIASSSGCSMIAAAGCGKTHLIAEAIASHGVGRGLVLTHTHAGVDALKRKLRKLRAPWAMFNVDTIAGLSLRLAASFPVTSGLRYLIPRTNDEWNHVYQVATGLLRRSAIKEILEASYSGIYVDEYQDCTVEQHALVVGLADVLPCRLIGDPLQGIFGFGSNRPVSWNDHVTPNFPAMPGPRTPWRWRDKNPDLGVWLQGVRTALEAGHAIDLREAPINWIPKGNPQQQQQRQLAACFEQGQMGVERAVAIHKINNQCRAVAKRLRGLYSCVEPIDSDDLYGYATRIEESEGVERAGAVLEFTTGCVAKLKGPLKTIRDAFAKGRIPKRCKYKDQLEALVAVAGTSSLRPVLPAIELLLQVPGRAVYRRELLAEMQRALKARVAGEFDDLHEAAWQIRNRTRRVGRRLPRCAVGTTLLVKGLEFDHAIVLDADGYDAKNLYVAMTRGARSLTIVSSSRTIRPKGLK